VSVADIVFPSIVMFSPAVNLSCLLASISSALVFSVSIAVVLAVINAFISVSS